MPNVFRHSIGRAYGAATPQGRVHLLEDLQVEKDGLVANTLFDNTLANVLSGIILGAISMLTLRFRYFRRRRALRFYGIRRSQNTIRIITSRLEVKKKGAAGTVQVRRGFTGSALPEPEREAATFLRAQIQANALAWLPRNVPDWVPGKFALAAPVDVTIEPAPSPRDLSSWRRPRSGGNLILLGGPVYNALVDHYQQQEGAHYQFIPGEPGRRGWRVKAVRGTDKDVFESRREKRELALIQRIICTETNAYVTMCSGTGAGATLAGALWLCRNFRRLDRLCRNRQYGVLLEFAHVIDTEDRFFDEVKVNVCEWMVEGIKKTAQESYHKKIRLFPQEEVSGMADRSVSRNL